MKFQNPISFEDAPDPFITYDEATGYYYGLCSLHNRLTVEAEQFTINAVKAISYADGEATMLQWN